MIGKTLSHYRLLEKIGEGGMGVVYRAEDTRLQRPVALKFLQPELTRDPEARERFFREARAAAALDHPHICTVHEIDEAEGQIFIAMAFVEGRSLRSRLVDGALGVEESARILVQVAGALKAAHDRGIVHRDIKPANIMLTSTGEARIMDFGLAKLERATELTSDGTRMGTAAYMSPEQARGERVDHRTDVWSLGCVLYEMLTGRPPFEGDRSLTLLHAILHDEPPPVTTRRSDVPAPMARVVHTCLQKDPAKRYARMDDLLADMATAAAAREAGVPSIAVLPFVDMSPARDQEYFCDGIAEELINGLTHVRNLRVVARTSAFAFKGQNADVREIGRRLNVRTVLEGSIRKAGDRLRITAQLINVEDGYHLWSEKFDRTLKDIFEIQDEVAAAIVESLRVSLLTGEKAAVEKRRAEDPEAYSLYLKGRYFCSRLSVENLQQALVCFQRAAERDPRFALAYVGMADVHGAIAMLALSEPREKWAQAKEQVQKALALDDQLAEAHGQMAVQAVYYDWDWAAAERSYQRAFLLNPGNAWTRASYAWFCTFMGRFDQGASEIRRALELDPLMPVFHAFSVGIHRYARRLDEAIAAFHRAIELDPHSGLAYFHVGTVYLSKGLLDEAKAAFERSLELTVFSGWAELGLGYALVRGGRLEEAERLLHGLIEKRRHGYVSSVCIAGLSGAVGNAELAFEYLGRAYEERDTLMPMLTVLPELADLHADARFRSLADRMRFPPSPE